MNKYIKQNFNKILGIFILIQPILDLITGICINTLNINITIGIIIRTLFLVFLMYTTAFIYKKKFSIYTYLALTIYSLFYLIGIIIYKEGVIFYELQGLLKTLFFPIMLVSLYDLKEEFKISNMTLFTALFMYLIFIIVPNILGLGFESYKITKSGNLGFFNSANEISGIISLLTPIVFIIIKDLKSKILKLVFIAIYLVVILTIGTKTPLLAFLITIGFTYIYYIIYNVSKKTYKPIAYITMLIIIGLSCLILILPKTNFYKNIKVHLEYLEVESITDVFKEKELIDHFIFSQRLTFLENKSVDYMKSSTYEKIFGIGYTSSGKQSKLIEMDYFDIFYSHGILGFIIIIGISLSIIYQILINSKKFTYETYMVKISSFLILILSFITGHIITAPAVTIIAVIIILNNSRRQKKDLLFAAYNMEIGGIETALICLLDNINYEKYNVTIILEKKTGILLDKINKNVTVRELKVSNHKSHLIRKFINFSRKLAFNILYHYTYDFSCCYATYSLSGNKVSRMASKNNAFYVHNNYKYVYKDPKDTIKFFNDRNIAEFRRIIFVSNESQTDFMEFYPELKDKTIVLNNFIDVNLIIEKSKDKIKEKKDKTKKLFVFIGRLDDDAKKVGRAINLVKEIKEINLWIVGDGPDRKLYEEQVKKNKLEKRVSFLGRKANPYPYMKQADYLILTSDYEGFPVTYLEAIVLKVPIITTIPTSDDKINLERDYVNVISKDENKMVKEVQRILKNPKKTKKIDINKVQENRIEYFENMFDEVI